MRTVDQFSIPQDSDVKYPFGSTIKNETETDEGTPIVEEYIGDIIQNLYKLLKLTGVTPNGIADSDSAQYQLVEALKKLPNSLNDIEQVLDLHGTIWSINLDITLLPDKYFMFAKASEDYTESMPYTFRGNTNLEYPFSSAGFRTGDTILLVLNQSGVKAYPISSASLSNDIAITLGSPLSFIHGNKMWYESQGNLMNDTPIVANIEQTLRTELVDASLVLNDMFLIKGVILCFCFIPTGNQYFFRAFTLPDLSASSAVTINGADFDGSDNYVPYVYAKKTDVYISNSMNYSPNAFSFSKLFFNAEQLTLYFNSSFGIDNSFDKTTNAAIKNGLLYTFINGNLTSWNLTSGLKTSLGNYPETAGQLFGFNDSVYFNVGQAAKKWF